MAWRLPIQPCSDWLHRGADLQYEQLPGRDRDATGAPPRTPERRTIGPTTRPFPGSYGRINASHGPGLRSRSPEPIRAAAILQPGTNKCRIDGHPLCRGRNALIRPIEYIFRWLSRFAAANPTTHTFQFGQRLRCWRNDGTKAGRFCIDAYTMGRQGSTSATPGNCGLSPNGACWVTSAGDSVLDLQLVIGPRGLRADSMTDPLVFLALVVAVGIGAQWVAWRLKIPSILLLLISGFALGFGANINPDDVLGRDIIFPWCRWQLRSSCSKVASHSNARHRQGALRRPPTRHPWCVGLLGALPPSRSASSFASVAGWRDHGAILTVTGPTVVGPMLRHIRPKNLIGSVIKWEGIVIDPVGAILAILVFEAVTSYQGPWLITTSLLRIIVVGSALGFVSAFGLVQSIRRYAIPDFLHVPLTLAIVLVIYVLGNKMAHEAGLMAVTLMGIAMGNQKSISTRPPIGVQRELTNPVDLLPIRCPGSADRVE